MNTREKVKFLVEWGMSAAKLGEPLHRSTVSKWLNGTGKISKEKELEIEAKIQKFKFEINRKL